MHSELRHEDADYGRRTLSLFLDESGHEEFKADQRTFAFGGIAGFSPQVEHALKLWRRMKGEHFGDADVPLHASGKMMTRPQIDAISQFFMRSRLPRFAFIIKRPPIFPPNVDALKLLRPILGEELMQMVGNLPTLPSDILICLEHSERLEPKIMATVPGLSLQVDEEEIPVAGLFTPKLPSNPMLEMADQITWRAQRQFREWASRRHLMPEFVSVFPEGASHAVYREMQVATLSGGEEPRWKLSFTEDDRVSVRLDWSGKAIAPNT
jgi:hypothetical protein